VTRSRWRIVAGIAIPVVLAIGVVVVLLLQGRHPAGQAAPTTAAPATTAPPQITTGTPNPPKATGENWLAIMSDILTYRHSLYENPQPNLLDQIYDKRCPCYAQERTALQDLARNGWRYNDNGVKVLKARLLGRAATNSSIVAVEVVSQSSRQVLTDVAGKIVEQTAASGPVKTPYQLLRGTDGRYRVTLIGVSQPAD
jgi:hypothetical protein